jgi:prepilin-type processing-associated H-X9-DG protein
MTTDLTGGLDPDWELVFAKQPDDPEMRESVNAWIWDDSGTFGIPRIGIEAVADQWETHDLQVNLAFADGRVYNVFGPGPVHDPIAADGRPRILGAGPLAFEIIEPYRHLRMTLDAVAVATTARAQIEGWMPGAGGGEQVPVRAEIDIRPAAPPWENGSTSDEARHILSTQEEGWLMGYPWRFEQLCRASGTITIGGEQHPLNGGANRIRRQSIRRLAKLRGHVWQAGLFPGGRGFGCIVYPPHDDGHPTYNEGYVFDGDGALIPARVVRAPFLRTLTPRGEDVSLVLETARGTIEIGGQTLTSTFHVMPPEVGGGLQLQQALASYAWDGESGTGMIERSITPDLLAG